MEKVALSGVVIPILTPIGPDGDLDMDSLERMVEFQVNAGVDGIFVLGTMGESNLLTNGQKLDVLRTVSRLLNGRLPLYAGVSDTSLSRVAENIAAAIPYQVDAYVCTLPFFTPVAEREQFHFYSELGSMVDRPLVAYNIPSLVGCSISTDVVRRLVERGVLAGIKESTDDLDRYGSLAELAREEPGFRVFTGHPSMMMTSYELGFAGAVIGVSNVIPRACAAIHRLWLAGHGQLARDLYVDVMDVFESIADVRGSGGYCTSIPIIKAVAVGLGLIRCGSLLPPYDCVPSCHWDRIAPICERIRILEDKSRTILFDCAGKEIRVKCDQPA
jgi:4-hydroxy-tetrahydrodipicolinate synthase